MIVYEDYLNQEAECTSVCNNFGNISAVGCTFAAWTKRQVPFGTLSPNSCLHYIEILQGAGRVPDQL